MMKDTSKHDQKIAEMTFASVYPHYVNKVVKKGKSVAELHEVISWLTGFDDAAIQQHLNTNSSFQAFFAAAVLNPKVSLITGVICGYRVEEINNPLTQKVRYLDKLVDELAKGRSMDKIKR